MKTSQVAEKLHPNRVVYLAASVASTAGKSRRAPSVLKKPAAKSKDGLTRHPTQLSVDFGKIRMHNSKARSYIQIVLPNGHYECLWSAAFKGHHEVTPIVFMKLVDRGGWAKLSLGALKDHVALGGDPVAEFQRLEREYGSNNESCEEEEQSETDSPDPVSQVSQEF